VPLDSGPLSLLSSPQLSRQVQQCNLWMNRLLASGARLVIPEIVDYELRRELLRANKLQGVALLDGLANLLVYRPLTTSIMREAARLWARARQQGYPTADAASLDVDIILAAHATALMASGDVVIVATTNVAHLSRFVPADLWTNIAP